MTDRTRASAAGEADAGGVAAVENSVVPWWQAEPGRLERDRRAIATRFTGLTWNDPPEAIRGAGGWFGRLPLWPFDRTKPAELARVGAGLLVQLVYPQAYPVLAPAIYPMGPQPEVMQLTDHRWHLNGDGSLCLLRSADQWNARDGVADLLIKAAAWRIEYALMRAGLIEAMTETGIVSTAASDSLIAQLPEASEWSAGASPS